MTYLVVAFPELKPEDFKLIQSNRKENDELYFNIIDPHFTLVFPVFDFTYERFLAEIMEKAADVKGFDFNLRVATINKDKFSDFFHVFLVPDEGYSNLVKLHDKLYSDKLIKNLHLDIDYVPHIGVGNSKDKHRCKHLVDKWNEKDFTIAGSISKLTVI